MLVVKMKCGAGNPETPINAAFLALYATFYWGEPAVRNEPRGWRKRGQDLMAICHNARKGRNTGSHWSKPVAPPLYSTKREEFIA